MKNIILKTLVVSLILFSNTLCKAQEDEYQTIFKNSERIKFSGFGSILTELSVSPSSDKIGTFYSAGVEGALLINQKFYIGVFGLSSVAPLDIRKPSANLSTKSLLFIQTGLSTGYKFQPYKALHITMGLRTGYGRLQEFERDSQWDDRSDSTRSIASFVLTPHVGLEVNFFPWMKFSVGVGYRQTWGDENKLNVNPTKDLSHPILQTGLSFGWFK